VAFHVSQAFLAQRWLEYRSEVFMLSALEGAVVLVLSFVLAIACEKRVAIMIWAGAIDAEVKSEKVSYGGRTPLSTRSPGKSPRKNAGPLFVLRSLPTSVFASVSLSVSDLGQRACSTYLSTPYLLRAFVWISAAAYALRAAVMLAFRKAFADFPVAAVVLERSLTLLLFLIRFFFFNAYGWVCLVLGYVGYRLHSFLSQRRRRAHEKMMQVAALCHKLLEVRDRDRPYPIDYLYQDGGCCRCSIFCIIF
jgi:hypothetical protein